MQKKVAYLVLISDESKTKARADFKNSYGVLMDCSEGTYGQLLDHFQDKETLNHLLFNLKVIYITHMHGDHHIGLAKILYERDLAIQETLSKGSIDKYLLCSLFVILPHFMHSFIIHQLSNLSHPHLVTLISSDHLCPNPERFYISQDPVTG
jgi:ribonuclease BN (tRNA processing enzyme)